MNESDERKVTISSLAATRTHTRSPTNHGGLSHQSTDERYASGHRNEPHRGLWARFRAASPATKRAVELAELLTAVGVWQAALLLMHHGV